MCRSSRTTSHSSRSGSCSSRCCRCSSSSCPRDGAADPACIGVAALGGDDHEVGELVRMERAKARLQGAGAIAGRFDDQLSLGFTLDRTLPPVRRRHRPVHVDACGQSFVDKRLSELDGPCVVGHRGEDKDEISHFFILASCTLIRVVVPFSQCPPRPRRPSAPEYGTGGSSTDSYCSSRRRSSSMGSWATAGCSRCCARSTSTTRSRPPSASSEVTTRNSARKRAA